MMNCHWQRKFVERANFVKVALSAFMPMMTTVTHSMLRKNFVRNVKPQLAHIANKYWGKRLTPEKLKPIIDKHKQPANCSDVVNSRVNPEIWGQLNAAKKSSDFRLAINMQQAIQKVALIILQTPDSLLAVMIEKDPYKVDLNKLVSNSVDSCALLGHVTNDLNNFRHEQIRPALKPELPLFVWQRYHMASGCSVRTCPNEFVTLKRLAKLAKSLQDHPANETSTTIDKSMSCA